MEAITPFSGSHQETDAFIIEIGDGGTPTLVWGQWLGGSATEFMHALLVAGDEIFVGGESQSSDAGGFNESVTFQGAHNSNNEGYVLEIGDGGTPTLVWGQWLGGSDQDSVKALAMNGDEIYAGGYSNQSTSFESVTFQGIMKGTDGFVVEVADGGTPSLVWGQWIGGASTFGQITSLAVTGDEIYVGGYNDATFDESSTFQGSWSGQSEGYVVEVADGGTPSIAWGQWLGGSFFDQVSAVAVVDNEIYAVGFSYETNSWESVTFAGALQSGSSEGFLIEIADDAAPGGGGGTDTLFFDTMF
jgi:hypothetical protein